LEVLRLADLDGKCADASKTHEVLSKRALQCKHAYGDAFGRHIRCAAE
jgi:hypothetical protein